MLCAWIRLLSEVTAGAPGARPRTAMQRCQSTKIHCDSTNKTDFYNQGEITVSPPCRAGKRETQPCYGIFGLVAS